MKDLIEEERRLFLMRTSQMKGRYRGITCRGVTLTNRGWRIIIRHLANKVSCILPPH